MLIACNENPQPYQRDASSTISQTLWIQEKYFPAQFQNPIPFNGINSEYCNAISKEASQCKKRKMIGNWSCISWKVGEEFSIRCDAENYSINVKLTCDKHVMLANTKNHETADMWVECK